MVKIRGINRSPTRRKYVIKPEWVVPCDNISDVVVTFPFNKDNIEINEEDSFRNLSGQVS